MTNDNPLAGFMDGLDQEEASARKVALAAIKQYDVERSNEAQDKARKDSYGLILKNWLASHPDETELVDNEHWHMKAYMQFGGRTANYDPPHVIKLSNPKLWARLEALGVFRIDHAAVEKAIAEGHLVRGDLFGYVHEGEHSPSLQVKPLR